ncbi:hypothetical protein BDD12DRAFT_749597 [Trichophaea hybrida]|nr:hypothetical protein BDD12DRAFT_749597 [Trichophaea hybrida]
MFGQTTFSGISLDAAGLVALADLSAISKRTAIIGSASALDIFFLAPGIHKHQNASEVNFGEQPATAALTTGYIFRVENPATVWFMQRIGVTGHLVNIHVEREKTTGIRSRYFLKAGVMSSILFLIGPAMTVAATCFLGSIHDWWGLGTILALALARLLNVVVIRRRSKLGWKGKSEPGVYGDLLVLLSEDRWIRVRGLVDDLKAVTSGKWLRNTTAPESFAVAVSTLIVYATAALAGNASKIGSITLLTLLLASVSLLGLSNELARTFHMHGRVLKVVGPPKPYVRRLDLAEELIKESKRKDWAIGLGMIIPETQKNTDGSIVSDTRIVQL